MTITHDALDLIVQPPTPFPNLPLDIRPGDTPASDIWCSSLKISSISFASGPPYPEALSVVGYLSVCGRRKRVVRMLLECLLVQKIRKQV